MTREESYIATAIGSDHVGFCILPAYLDEHLHGPPKPKAVSIMAHLGNKRVAVHIEKMPLRTNWKDRAVAHFLSERERA
jgi:hypothetical protein